MLLACCFNRENLEFYNETQPPLNNFFQKLLLVLFLRWIICQKTKYKDISKSMHFEQWQFCREGGIKFHITFRFWCVISLQHLLSKAFLCKRRKTLPKYPVSSSLLFSKRITKYLWQYKSDKHPSKSVTLKRIENHLHHISRVQLHFYKANKAI